MPAAGSERLVAGSRAIALSIVRGVRTRGLAAVAIYHGRKLGGQGQGLVFRLFLRLGEAISALRAPLCTPRHSIPLDLGFEPPMKRRDGCPTKARNPAGLVPAWEAMNADALDMVAHSLEPLGLELSPLPDQGPDEFWIELAREEMARIQKQAADDKLEIKRVCAVRHKKSTEQKDALISALTKELEAARAAAFHWQAMYKSKAPAKELEELKKHVVQAEASTTTVIDRLRVQVEHLQMELRACLGPLGT